MALSSKSLEDYFNTLPTGSMQTAIADNLRGIDHRQTPNLVPMNKESQGYVFFTRPQLNLQKDNIRNVRQLASLLSDVPNSIQTYIRTQLDPRLIEGADFGAYSTPRIQCPVTDNMNPFITVLTNNFVSMSGWPSVSVPTRTTQPGLYNESQTIVDGRVILNETFDLTVNFRNTKGDPVLFMFYVWALYMAGVFEGKLVPYLDFIVRRELDYNTRIYRLVMDHEKNIVTKIASCNAGIPVGVPVGDPFDVQEDKTYSESNRVISMRFKCDGVRYFDPLTVKNFNDTVKMFNLSMYDSYRDGTMVKIPRTLLNLFNRQKTYPRINPNTMELEWWCFSTDFQARTSRYLNSVSSAAGSQGDYAEEYEDSL